MLKILAMISAGAGMMGAAHAEEVMARFVHPVELMAGNVKPDTLIKTGCFVANMASAHGQCAVPNHFGEFGAYWIDLDFSRMPNGPDYLRETLAGCSDGNMRPECKFVLKGRFEERNHDEWIVVSEARRYE